MTLCCCLEPNGKTSNQHVEMPTQSKFTHGTSQESSLIQTQKSRKYDVKCNNNNNNKEGKNKKRNQNISSSFKRMSTHTSEIHVVGENKEQDMNMNDKDFLNVNFSKRN
jgi:hypothetical protein